MSYSAETVDRHRVATYIRWSTDEQSDGTTLEVQRDACRLFIESQGWVFREDLLFIDDGCSGGTLDRPGLNRLRKAVEAGRVGCVVVYKLDRLSRSVLDTVKLVLEEWDGVCFIRSTREPIDTASPTGAIFFYMLASYAEWERSIIRERTMSGKIRRAQQGKNPGFTPPYGYARGAEAGQLMVDEAEAVLVRRIYREFIGGKGAHTIAGGLNADGLRPRRAKAWHYSTILAMLSNPVYMGVLRYGMTTLTSKAQRKQVGKARLTFEEARHAHVEGAVPVIIPAEEYEKAQRIRASRQAVVGARARGADFLLTGIARCKCGATIRGDGREKTGDKRYYRCSGNVASNLNRCGCTLMLASRLDEAVVGAVRAALAPGQRGSLLAGWQAEASRKRAAVAAEVEQVRGALVLVEKKRARVGADYVGGDLPAKLYAAHVEELEREEEGLGLALSGLEERLSQLSAAGVDLGEFEELAQRVDSWEALGPEEQKQVLRFVIARCEVFRKKGDQGRHADNPNPIEVDLELRQAGYS